LRCLDEFAQPRLDPGTDPAQLAHPLDPHEISDADGSPRIVSAAHR
jgi:hypothetical protein